MKKYKSIIFDCDGVILNSNEIKTESFRKVSKQFRHKRCSKNSLIITKIMVVLSRYIKLDYFLNQYSSKIF